MMEGNHVLLQVEHLAVTFLEQKKKKEAVKDISFSIVEGECLCLVGPSGCGKSVTASALLGLLPRNGTVQTSGSIRWQGKEYLGAPERECCDVRGRVASLVLQEPAAALDPVRTIGWQLNEVLKAHTDLGGQARRERGIALLEEVGLADAPHQWDRYPHQLSGGMCQRVVIALALASAPRLLIADEPTTALDATIQSQILELLHQEQRERGMALLLITHDMGVVARMADRVVVMEGGFSVEEAPVKELFAFPKHSMTQRLLQAAGAVRRGDGA